jgi:hypothetical protein
VQRRGRRGPPLALRVRAAQNSPKRTGVVLFVLSRKKRKAFFALFAGTRHTPPHSQYLDVGVWAWCVGSGFLLFRESFLLPHEHTHRQSQELGERLRA